MKKIILSAAVAAMAFSTSAVAADKGIDINVGGQAVIYYETANGDAKSEGMLDSSNSRANVGVQLNLDSDLGNNFTFGSQLTYIGTAGLEKNTVDGVRAGTTSVLGTAGNSTTDELALTKIFMAKKIGNTTVKLGRQELPKSLSPLAFSEGWNLYKNTFDAILAVNTSIPKTTLVGAYVSGGTGAPIGGTSSAVSGNLPSVAGEAYMITAQTKAIPMTTVTATYYSLNNVLGNTANVVNPQGGVDVDAYFLKATIGDKLPLGLKVGLQLGMIEPDGSIPGYVSNVTGAYVAGSTNALDDTTAYGAKISLKPMDALSLSIAGSSVDGAGLGKASIAMRNTGTNIKTPLYTQMIYNQNAIALDADTLVGKVSFNTGSFGSFTVQYGSSEGGRSNLLANGRNTVNYEETDVIYKVKAGGVNYFAAYIHHTVSDGGSMVSTSGPGLHGDSDNIVRVWARYNF